MLSDKKIYDNGTEVLIFKYIREWGIDQDYNHYKKGKIIKSEISEDLSYHGSSWHVVKYTVLSEDGIEYYGNYGRPTIGNCFIMTRIDYMLYRLLKKALD